MAITAAQLNAVVQVQGAQQAQSDLQSVGKSADSSQQSFGGMIKSGLATAASFAIFNVGAKAVGFVKDQLADTIQVAMVHQQVMAQTAQAIKSTGDASGMTAQSIQNLAMSLSQVTPFSDDTIQSAENMMLTFTNIGKNVFPQATQTALDMAQALNEGPTQASMMLGKALDDPTKGITALTRVGVTFTQQQKDQIAAMQAAGNMAGAQGIIIKELGKEFGGSAQAAGQTFGGQLSILQNKLMDVKQQIGGALLPILGSMLSTVSGAVMPVLQNFGNWFANTAAPAIQRFGTTVGNIFTAVGHYLSLFDLKPISDAWKQLVDAVQPVIAPLSNAGNAFKAMSPTLVDIRNDISQILVAGIRDIAGIITDIANAIKFLTSNSIQAQVVKDLLIGIGIAIATIKIGQFVSTIPSLVTSFQVWAAGAWEAAAGTIAATWPLLAIGAVIAIVVAGIILAVQHWGQISSWLQGVWSAFSSWFMSALGAIGNFFHTIWNGIVSGIQAAWNAIVNAVKAGIALVVDIIFGPIIAIANMFIWLYNHNTYFQELIDSIMSIFKAGLAWVQNIWQNDINWLVGLWQGLVNTATRVWGSVSSAVMSVVNTIVGWIQNAWNTEVRGLEIIWGYLSGFAQTAWNKVVAVFQGVFGPIGAALNKLWSNITGIWNGFVNQAEQFGKNLIQNIINGITGMASAVGNAVSGVADKIKNFLGFHSPAKEGPGSEADVWAPNFVKMYAAGLKAGMPQIQEAVSNLIKPISMSINPATNSSLTALPAGTNAIPSNLSQTPLQGGNGNPIILMLDGRAVGMGLMPYIANGIRYSVGGLGF